MVLLPDTKICGLRIRRECRERFPRRWLQKKPPVSDPDKHPSTCVMHVPWCMSGSLIRGGGKNVPDIRGACATSNFTYLVRGPWRRRENIPPCTDNWVNKLGANCLMSWMPVANWAPKNLRVIDSPATVQPSVVTFRPCPLSDWHQLSGITHRSQRYVCSDKNDTPLGCLQTALAYRYHFVWRRHENMPRALAAG